MKAAVLGHEVVRVVERDMPEPKPGWVRLAVQAVGICGTDLHLYRGAMGKVDGVQPGHEVAGIVDKVGDGVAVASGIHVALEPLTGCGMCAYCRVGEANRCAERKLFGVAARGGMAEYMIVPASCLYELSPGLSFNVGALAEPMAVCVRGVRLGQVGLGSRVAVIGAGSIGLLSIVAAKAAGAGEVLAVARHPHQAELAKSAGADAVVATAKELMIQGAAPDVVIETVGGQSDTLAEAVRLVRTGGRIVMLGLFEGKPGVPGLEFSLKEATLIGSNCYGRHQHTGDFELATRLVTQYAATVAQLITHRFTLDQVDEAYRAAGDKATRSIKVQIEP